MKIIRKNEVARFRAPDTVFTGEVWVDPVFDAPAPARAGSALVTFEPAGPDPLAQPSLWPDSSWSCPAKVSSSGAMDRAM